MQRALLASWVVVLVLTIAALILGDLAITRATGNSARIDLMEQRLQTDEMTRIAAENDVDAVLQEMVAVLEADIDPAPQTPAKQKAQKRVRQRLAEKLKHHLTRDKDKK